MNTIPETLSSSVKSNGSSQTVHSDRKRRDNINDRIQELLALIPREYFYENSTSATSTTCNNSNGEESVVDTPGSAVGTPRSKGTGTKDGKPNKGQILTQAVEYITSLQNQVDSKNREEVEYMLQLSKLAKAAGVTITDINLENTSAEVELGHIGVGPLGGSAS
ncbi:retrograde regulation protein 1 [Monosporozyma servazzii]